MACIRSDPPYSTWVVSVLLHAELSGTRCISRPDGLGVWGVRQSGRSKTRSPGCLGGRSRAITDNIRPRQTVHDISRDSFPVGGRSDAMCSGASKRDPSASARGPVGDHTLCAIGESPARPRTSRSGHRTAADRWRPCENPVPLFSGGQVVQTEIIAYRLAIPRLGRTVVK